MNAILFDFHWEGITTVMINCMHHIDIIYSVIEYLSSAVSIPVAQTVVKKILDGVSIDIVLGLLVITTAPRNTYTAYNVTIFINAMPCLDSERDEK